MPRILLACHEFFPRFYTGTEILTLEVAEELRRRNHEVSIVTVEPILPGDCIPEHVELVKDYYQGLPVWRFYVPHVKDVIERMDRESYEEPLQPFFEQILDEVKPEIVHAFHLMRLTGAFVKSVKKRNIPFYMTITDFWLLCNTHQLLRHDGKLCSGQESSKCFACFTGNYLQRLDKKPLKISIAQKLPKLATMVHPWARKFQQVIRERIMRQQKVFRMADGIIWSNPFIREIFRKNKFINHREYIVPFPVPERAAGLFDLPAADTEGRLKAAFIGTLINSKGPQVLLEACRLLSDADGVDVFIWGSSADKTYEAGLQRIVEGLEWVRFCGTFRQEQFPDVLRDIHVVVIPSLWYENTPLTALSALAAKRILVVSDLGGLSNLVEHEVSGFTFSPGDAKQLSSILRELAKNKARLGEIRKAIPAPNTVAKYVDELEKIYLTTDGLI